MAYIYQYKKGWRLKNREKRNEERRRNYATTRKYVTRPKRRWLDEDVRAIFAPGRPSDRVLSRQLNRSVQAIQDKRYLTDSPFLKDPLD